jgi:3-deoxy-7-phosphoheptulonate synthase
MLVNIKKDTTQTAINEFIKLMESKNQYCRIIDNYKILISGENIKNHINEIEASEIVDSTKLIQSKYKLASKIAQRDNNNNNNNIHVGGLEIGGDDLAIIAGPCAVESRQQLFDIAGELHEMGIKYLRGGIYKPRSSPYSFQGLKEKGLEIFADVKKEFGMKIVTEVVNPDKLQLVSEVADIIQIGSRNMQNYQLLEECGKISTPILLKRGMSATIEDFLLSAEYVMSSGNRNVILCERGIRTFDNFTRNTLDLNAVPAILQESHLPIIVDPSHGTGIRSFVEPMGLAGIACGAHGLIVEVHNKPEKAFSDGMQSLTPKQFKEFYKKIQAVKDAI